ncbi:MAG: helix-turn-helix domain-containing protein, partial [Candidatus Binatia bacterium]
MRAGRKVTTDAARRRAQKLARELRTRRSDALGLTAEALGQRAGVSIDAIRKIERGVVADPGFFMVGRLANALGADL